MPYKTGVLLDAGQTKLTESTVSQVSKIFSPIMKDFFGEEPEISCSGANYIGFITPINMHLGLDAVNDSRYFFHLMASPTSSEFWNVAVDAYGSSKDSALPLMYHVATNKSNTIMSLGVGFPSIGNPFFTVTIVKTGDSYIAIQHSVTDKRSDADKARLKDAYHKSETDCKMTSAKAAAGYYSDSKLVLVPAIDPWTGDVIPDLYLSLLRPSDTRPLRNLISVNGRQLISGVVSDYSSDECSQAMPMFIAV